MATVKELGRLRYWLELLRTLRKSYDVYVDIAERIRREAVTMIVNNLWNRYRAHTKNEESPLDFALWLDRKQRLEETYLNRFSYKVRRRWATWQVETALNALLVYSNQDYDENGEWGWFIQAINEALAAKQPESQWSVYANTHALPEVKPRTSETLTELQRRRASIPAGITLSFNAYPKGSDNPFEMEM